MSDEELEEARRAVHTLVDTFSTSLIGQGKNTPAQRDELIDTDHQLLIFTARMLELRADIDEWCRWAKEKEVLN